MQERKERGPIGGQHANTNYNIVISVDWRFLTPWLLSFSLKEPLWWKSSF